MISHFLDTRLTHRGQVVSLICGSSSTPLPKEFPWCSCHGYEKITLCKCPVKEMFDISHSIKLFFNIHNDLWQKLSVYLYSYTVKCHSFETVVKKCSVKMSLSTKQRIYTIAEADPYHNIFFISPFLLASCTNASTFSKRCDYVHESVAIALIENNKFFLGKYQCFGGYITSFSRN
jgi:hypothetical protein